MLIWGRLSSVGLLSSFLHVVRLWESACPVAHTKWSPRKCPLAEKRGRHVWQIISVCVRVYVGRRVDNDGRLLSYFHSSSTSLHHSSDLLSSLSPPSHMGLVSLCGHTTFSYLQIETQCVVTGGLCDIWSACQRVQVTSVAGEFFCIRCRSLPPIGWSSEQTGT